MNKKPKILFVARDDGGCGFFRCTQPANFLNRAGLADAKTVLLDPTPKELLEADLVVMQFAGSPEASQIANFLRKNNVPYVTEFDDFIQHVSPNNKGGYSAWNPSTLFVHRSMEMARLGFGMTVSTNWLAREYFPYNKNIYVIPNYLDKEKWMNPVIKKEDGKVRIGWAGGNAHADDLLMVSEALKKVIKNSKNNVKFETFGMTESELNGVFPNLENPKGHCISCGHEGDLEHHPGELIENYPLILSTMGWDFAIAPVIDNSFGNSKSDIKIKEYAAVGLPIIASPVRPYLDAAKDGAYIFFAETHNDWVRYMEKLSKDKKLRDQITKHNKEWVEKYWIQDRIHDNFEIYSHIVKQAKIQLGDKTIAKQSKKSGIIKS